MSATFPSGAHICEVEIDAETGQVALVRYCAVDDVGRVLNPLLCEGQIHGGIAQGVGQALMEDVVYDRRRAAAHRLVPGLLHAARRGFLRLRACQQSIPTTRNPLGVKGVGEAGTIGALPAVMNAVNHALAEAGAAAIEMPATPEKIWRALRVAKAVT